MAAGIPRAKSDQDRKRQKIQCLFWPTLTSPTVIPATFSSSEARRYIQPTLKDRIRVYLLKESSTNNLWTYFQIPITGDLWHPQRKICNLFSKWKINFTNTYIHTRRQFKKTQVHNKHDLPPKRGNKMLSWNNRKMPLRTSSMIFSTIQSTTLSLSAKLTNWSLSPRQSDFRMRTSLGGNGVWSERRHEEKEQTNHELPSTL